MMLNDFTSQSLQRQMKTTFSLLHITDRSQVVDMMAFECTHWSRLLVPRSISRSETGMQLLY